MLSVLMLNAMAPFKTIEQHILDINAGKDCLKAATDV